MTVQLTDNNVALLFVTLDTGWQHAVVCAPDGRLYLLILGRAMVH